MRFLPILALAAVAAAGPDDGRRLKPDHAPTPFTAEEIRAGCPEGRTATFLVEQTGHPQVRQTMRFARGDAKGTAYENSQRGPDGQPLGSPRVTYATWKQLQEHASYPAAVTKITDETVKLPAGEFECWRYTVSAPNAVRKFWFAKDLPGPPVKVVAVSGDRTFSMVLESNRPFDFALWFGPQEAAGGVAAKDVAIDLRVADGADLKPETVATLLGGKVHAMVVLQPGAGLRYVVAETARGVEGAVRITKGPLKDALIHVRGGKAMYALPRGARIPTGALEFEVVALKKTD